jgi:Leucine-rich repeat (LRR) protein
MHGGLMQLCAYGVQDVFNYKSYLNSSIISYEYNLAKNICNEYNDYGDDFEFMDIKFCDEPNINNNDILFIKNFSKKYYDIAINCSNQKFKKIFIHDERIKYLNCSFNQIGLIDFFHSNIIFLVIKNSINFDFNIIKLPPTLIYLDCSNNEIDKINLDRLKNLKYLICCENSLKDINNIKLPKKIKYLDLSGCLLNSFSINSNTPKIEYLLIKKNSLESIDLSNLTKLKYLDISSNPKLNFNPNNLPSGLKVLLCSDTNCSDFYNLPLSLKKLDCSHNKISNLDYLPESILWLNCSNTKVSNLSNLPIGLKHINFDDTLFVDEIKKNNINHFNILPKKINIFTNEID